MSGPADPAAAGSLDRTGYDLLLALQQQPGCPVCGVTQAAVGRGLEAISYEAVNDPGARERLRASFAYCAVHGRQWWELQNTLGTAIIYRDMCNAARTLIEQAASGEGAGGRLRSLLRGGGSDAGRALARALRPQAPCPGCRQSAETEAAACASFAAALKETSFFEAFAAHAVGLCLPHLRAVAARINDAALVTRVAQAHAARLAAAEADLSEVVRKYDYRFNREPHGAEFDAPLRSIEQMGGRLPTLLNEPASPDADH